MGAEALRGEPEPGQRLDRANCRIDDRGGVADNQDARLAHEVRQSCAQHRDPGELGIGVEDHNDPAPAQWPVLVAHVDSDPVVALTG